MAGPLENPFYYLENFHTVLAWIRERYSDLLTPGELEFIARFTALPQASRALMVRMVMRKGDFFRASKLNYAEIGDTREAARALIDNGWIDEQPLLTLEQLFALLKKNEIAEVFGPLLPKTSLRKSEQFELLNAQLGRARVFSDWYPHSGDCVFQVGITDLCDRLRLMFFGNFSQDWSEFVLSDLGIFKYEKVAFSNASRGFRTRQDVDDYLQLHRCRERFYEGDAPQEILKELPASVLENDWLESRRAKFVFQVGQHYEQIDALQDALAIYDECAYPGARIRAIRVRERCAQFEAAFTLAQAAQQMPESEAEKQQLLRIMPRLHRKLGKPKIPARASVPPMRLDLTLCQPETAYFVEGLVRDHLSLQQTDAHVHYVENALINSLFGLLCWEAVFSAVPGAFFHPFHRAPADLLSPDFHRRRSQLFADCLAQLDSQQYKTTIMKNFGEKMGIQSPFVFWGSLSEQLLALALDCLPAAHLKKWFERMLLDIKSNRTGFPDLILFWPREKRYQMIEVKGPGDRLQDNQIRWLDYCAANGMPVTVCYVQWAESAA
ncbi:MAG: VRR-NUC domain-containing protein [Pseudomonadota bacterium]